jgi:hypothetical protein
VFPKNWSELEPLNRFIRIEQTGDQAGNEREREKKQTCSVSWRQGDVVERWHIQKVVVDVDVEHGDLPIVCDPVVLIRQGVGSVATSDRRAATPSSMVIIGGRSAIAPSDVLDDSARKRSREGKRGVRSEDCDSTNRSGGESTYFRREDSVIGLA